MAKKEKIIIPDEKEELSITGKFDAEFLDLPEDLQEKIKELAYLIGQVGLPESEACELLDIEPDWLKTAIERRPVIGKIIYRKKIEFKKNLLKTVAMKAKNGDDKMAQWLLERTYPEQYGSKRKGAEGSSDDLLGAAIEFVQESNSNNGVVQRKSARMMLIKQKSIDPEKQVVNKLNELLV